MTSVKPPEVPPKSGESETDPSPKVSRDHMSWRARAIGTYTGLMAFVALYLLIVLWPPPTIPDQAIAVLDADTRALDSASRPLIDSVIQFRLGSAGVPAARLQRWRQDSARMDSTYRDAQIRLSDRRGRADSLRAARINQIVHQSDISLLFGLVHLPNISLDLRLILLAMAAGLLGAFVHAAQSFVTYTGNRTFRTSWGWWYLLRPFIGGVLGAILYFTVRGALFPNALSAAAEVSPFGVGAIGALAGLCSKQATDKLDELFTVLFRVPSQSGDAARHDSMTGGPKPAATGVTPSPAPADGRTNPAPGAPVVPRPPEADVPDANPF